MGIWSWMDRMESITTARIAILTVATNIHAIRWINALAERGVDMVVITQQPPLPGDYHPSVRFELLPFRGRLAYLLNALALPQVFARTGARLLHVHYAGGYGATLWLSGIRDALISVWGGDVYDVPGRSMLHRTAVCRALEKAVRVTSTSHVMKAQVERLGVRTRVDVVPFGVDTSLFRPGLNPRQKNGRLVIGTVKTLAPKYGIDTLIRGFELALRDPAFRARDPELRLVGGGRARRDYERLTAELGLEDRIRFYGEIRHAEVPAMLSGFDIYAAISRDDSESFGVAVIEASACGLPVLVSDAGGLPEVVEDEVTGIIVPRSDPRAVARALLRLAADPALRQAFGAAGRERVKRLYEWSGCVDEMLAIYAQIIGRGTASQPQDERACRARRDGRSREPLRIAARLAEKS